MLPAFLHFTGEDATPPSAISLMIWGYVATAGAFALMALAGLRGGDLARKRVHGSSAATCCCRWPKCFLRHWVCRC